MCIVKSKIIYKHFVEIFFLVFAPLFRRGATQPTTKFGKIFNDQRLRDEQISPRQS